MTLQALSVALVGLLTLSGDVPIQPRESPNRVTVTGRVVEVYAGGLFTIREEAPGGRELVVLAPRPLSPALAGANVRVEGALRRLTPAELKKSTSSVAAGEELRARFVNRMVLVASSVAAALEETPAESPAPAERPSPLEIREAERQPTPAESVPTGPLVLRASMLAADLEGFAGQRVKVLHARVVGVLDAHAFLVEPATHFLKDMGTRDRIVVLIQNGELGVPAELAVGEIVSIEGTARSLLSMQVTREVPWPARLEAQTIKRLEVRAAVLATSVQTAEGTELIAPRTAAVR